MHTDPGGCLGIKLGDGHAHKPSPGTVYALEWLLGAAEGRCTVMSAEGRVLEAEETLN
jgi:hypothetical protein